MPGFRFCPWCDGKGCVACDAEQEKFVKKALADAPKWRDGDVRDVRDAWVKAEQLRGWAGKESMTPDQVEAMFQPALDAEYERQFPAGPQPMFTARTDNPDDLDLLATFASVESLDRIFAGGVTKEAIAEMARLAGKATLTQATRQTLCPNESDAKDSTTTS